MDRRQFISSAAITASILALPGLALAQPPQSIVCFGHQLELIDDSIGRTYIKQSDLWHALKVRFRHDRVWIQLGWSEWDTGHIAYGPTLEQAEQAFSDYAEQHVRHKPYLLMKAEMAIQITQTRHPHAPDRLIEDEAFRLMEHSIKDLVRMAQKP